jgi:DNA-directed RNA polymerase subunit RPC12/RpoP
MTDSSFVNMFNCANCSRQLSVVPDYIGRLVACPYCGSMFIMPSLSPQSLQRGASEEADDGTIPIVAEKKNDSTAERAGTVDLTKTPIGPMSQATPYIIPELARPGGIAVLAVLGLMLSITGLVLAISALVIGTETLFSGDRLMLDDSIYSQVKFAMYCLYMLLYLLVCMGLLKGRNSARRIFVLLTLLFIFGELIQIGLASYKGEQLVNPPLDFLKVIALVYMLGGMLYLLRSRIGDWFD